MGFAQAGSTVQPQHLQYHDPSSVKTVTAAPQQALRSVAMSKVDQSDRWRPCWHRGWLVIGSPLAALCGPVEP